MKARIARSVGPTHSFQSRTTAATKAANGITTAARFMERSSFDML
jgi:hypothetical protein